MDIDAVDAMAATATEGAGQAGQGFQDFQKGYQMATGGRSGNFAQGAAEGCGYQAIEGMGSTVKAILFGQGIDDAVG
ncbi:hypothetical protein, partial [Streptomyces sp. 1222.5]|uniref:hypothetical protein n=1 Tax=Streptomyces sp. 1222.5 TaxID=1881026 RepID=UPI003D7627BB